MKHFKISVAGLYVTISARGALTYDLCRSYLTDAPWSDITLYATPKEMEKKRASMPMPMTDEQAECLVLSDQLSLKLLPFQAFLLHAAVITKDDCTYAFCAPRGVGKTTHVTMWETAYGSSSITIINGDKPIIRRAKDGAFYAYGTPWCGKERRGTPTGVPLHCITFIERDTINRTLPVTHAQYVDRLIGQVVFPADPTSMNRGAALLADLIRSVPAAIGYCNMTPEAARVVHDFWQDRPKQQTPLRQPRSSKN